MMPLSGTCGVKWLAEGRSCMADLAMCAILKKYLKLFFFFMWDPHSGNPLFHGQLAKCLYFIINQYMFQTIMVDGATFQLKKIDSNSLLPRFLDEVWRFQFLFTCMSLQKITKKSCISPRRGVNPRPSSSK